MRSHRHHPRQFRFVSVQCATRIITYLQLLLFFFGDDRNIMRNDVLAFSFHSITTPPLKSTVLMTDSIAWGIPPPPPYPPQDRYSIRHSRRTMVGIRCLPLRPLRSTLNNNIEDEQEAEPFTSTTNTPATSLSNEEIGRYSRHLVLSNVGMVGQLTLKQSAVLVIGAGGLGSPVLLYLAAAGVGQIGIVDGDTVDVSNLQRQIIHNVHTVHTSKCQSAQKAILQLNPNVNVRIYEEEFTVNTAPRIISDGFAPNIPWSIVIDGSDNFPTKYLIKYVPFSCGWAYGMLCLWKYALTLVHVFSLYLYWLTLKVISVHCMVYHGYILRF